jgi:hypothetical protein
MAVSVLSLIVVSLLRSSVSGCSKAILSLAPAAEEVERE